MRQKLPELKGEVEKSTNAIGNFSSFLSQTDRTTSEKNQGYRRT